MSSYVPLNWVDGTTPLNEANLDHMEQGIDAAMDLALALDALPKIPTPLEEGEWLTVSGGAMVWAPAPAGGGGGGLDWEGNWVGSTAYVKGDVVTKDGVVYGAVNDSTGQTPPPFSPVPLSFAPIPVGVTLPASPFDGQEAILTDSLTVPTYMWHFRYMASIMDAYKWVFLGGVPINTTYEMVEITTGAAYTTPLGPVVTTPRDGIYDLEHTSITRSSGGGAHYFRFCLYSPTAAIAGAREHVQDTQAGNSRWIVFCRDRLTIAAAKNIAIEVKSDPGGFNTQRQLMVRPVRVS